MHQRDETTRRAVHPYSGGAPALLGLLLIVGPTAPAFAQHAEPMAELAAPAVAPRPQVRSSHTVDVIAPGEGVDSVLSLARTELAAPPAPRAPGPPPNSKARGPEGSGGRRDAPGTPGGAPSGPRRLDPPRPQGDASKGAPR